MLNNKKQIVELLEDPDFQSLAKRTDYYCPFEAMKVDRHEIRHSNYLAHILKPYASHGFGYQVLQIFLDSLANMVKDYDLSLAIKTHDFNDVDIRREWKNIDLTIALNKIKIIFVFEIKVEANEGKEQLKKYMNIVNSDFSNYKKYYFYLTPYGSEPSIRGWEPINFETMVSALEVAHDSFESSLATQMLSSYINLLKRKYITDTTMDDTVSRIWKKHHAALSYLIENVPDGVIDTSIDLFIDDEIIDSINESIAHENISLIVDHKTSRCIRLAVPQWDRINDFMSANWTRSGRIFLCEVYVKNDQLIVKWVIGRQADSSLPSTIRQDLFNALEAKGRLSPIWKTVSSSTLNISEHIGSNESDNEEKKSSEIKDFLKKTLKDNSVKFHAALKKLS